MSESIRLYGLRVHVRGKPILPFERTLKDGTTQTVDCIVIGDDCYVTQEVFDSLKKHLEETQSLQTIISTSAERGLQTKVDFLNADTVESETWKHSGRENT